MDDSAIIIAQGNDILRAVVLIKSCTTVATVIVTSRTDHPADDEALPGPPVCTVLLRLAFPVPGPKLLPLGTLPLLLLLLFVLILEPKGDVLLLWTRIWN